MDAAAVVYNVSMDIDGNDDSDDASSWQVTLSARIAGYTTVSVNPECPLEFFGSGKLCANTAGSSNSCDGVGNGAVLEIQRRGTMVWFFAGHVGDGVRGTMSTQLPHNASYDAAIRRATEFVDALKRDDFEAAMRIANECQH